MIKTAFPVLAIYNIIRIIFYITCYVYYLLVYDDKSTGIAIIIVLLILNEVRKIYKKVKAKVLANTYNPLSDLKEDYMITGEGAAFYKKGSNCINKGKYKYAIKNFKKAADLAQLSKERSACYFLIGACYQKLNKLDEEVAAYERAVNLDSGSLLAWIYLNDAYYRIEDYEKYKESGRYLDEYFKYENFNSNI